MTVLKLKAISNCLKHVYKWHEGRKHDFFLYTTDTDACLGHGV